ncbi:MAG: Mini-ribonuclease 3 [Ruminococcus sp.]|jgi:ribonuclease-3 family protein
MEESLTYFKERFQLADVDVRTYSPLALAYIGDSIYDLLIRTMIMSEGNMPVQQLHRKSSRLVKAQKQSEMMEKIRPHLTEEEERVYKRGKNAKPHTTAKNASLADYHRATGFEAVMGYLYLSGNIKRIVDLMKVGLE